MICIIHKKEYRGIYYDTKDRYIILYTVYKCKKCGKVWKEEINKTQYDNSETLRKDLIIVRKTNIHIGELI